MILLFLFATAFFLLGFSYCFFFAGAFLGYFFLAGVFLAIIS
jgi:hypothetical protein